MKIEKRHNGYIEAPRVDWVAVGDASKFVILEKRKGSELKAVKTFENRKARAKVSELEKDQPGRAFESFAGNGSSRARTRRSAYTSQQDPKEHAVETFVRDVSDYLDDAYASHSYNRLILVANSRLLGQLREFLDEPTQSAIFAEHRKDFAWVPGEELVERVQPLMNPQ